MSKPLIACDLPVRFERLARFQSSTDTMLYASTGNRAVHVDEVTSDVTTYTYDDANRLLTAEDPSGITTYTYDATGNRLTIEEPSSDITTNTWNCENRLVQVEHPDSGTVEYAYNGDGLSVEQTVDGSDTTREIARGHCCLSGNLTPTSNVQWLHDIFREPK